jgi:hypothetical protein
MLARSRLRFDVASLVLIACVASSSACLFSTRVAQAQAFAAGRITGFGPDAQVTGGIGFELGEMIDNPFLARLRLGGLYAYEPFVIHLGVTGEVGALAELGLGGELELDHFNGAYVQLAAASTNGPDLMLHAAVGYTIVGVEWQHRFADVNHGGESDALLLQVRLPLGLWWLLREREEEPPPPSGGQLAIKAVPEAMLPPEPVVARTREPDPDAIERARTALEQGQAASLAGDQRTAATRFAQAYAEVPDPLYLLPLADAEIALGRWVAAGQTLKRFLANATSIEAVQRKPAASALLEDVDARSPKLRLSLLGAAGYETVEIDGISVPEALLGYDVPIEPGEHRLVVQRGAAKAVTRTFTAQERSIVRIEIDLASEARDE